MSQPLDLAPVGNCLVAGLFDRHARLTWFCWPRLDGDPVFCALLDGEHPEGGFMDALPRSLASAHQAYRRNTAILETTLRDADGSAFRCVDWAPRSGRFGRSFRPPTLVRRLEPVEGQPLVTVRVRPRFDWGRDRPTVRTGGSHVRWLSPETGAALRVTTDAPIGNVAHEQPFVLDRPYTFILGHDETVPENPEMLGRDFLRETEGYWTDWVRGLSIPFEWQEAVIRAAITLKLCAFEETGGVVAALTTSVPEAPGSQRNWDYRFCWPRDTAFTVEALNRLGATRTMEEFMRYITNVVALAGEGGPLRPVYHLTPSMPLEERLAPALAGFRGMGPVRVGNQAAEQVQNDAYGWLVLAASQMFFDARLARPAGETLFRMLEPLGERAEAAALTPDAGIWEYRGRERVHTFSAAMCWAALSRLGHIARRLGLPAEARRWGESAARLRAEIAERAWRPDLNAWTESFGGDGMDAALLLLPEIGFCRADDPRFLGTLDLAGKRLLRGGGLLLRYDMEDDFGAPETAFLVCAFWYVDALAAAGRREEARAMFEGILARRNHVGLLSEDVDPRTGWLWGNFPQTYSHVGLVLSASRLSRSWEEGLWGGS